MAAAVSAPTSVFVKLVEDGQVGTVTIAFERAIAKSFETHPMRQGVSGISSAEVKRRFEICAKIFVKLKGDLKWGLQRALDHVSEYLTAELNGSDWVPDARACWMPGDD